MEGNLYFYRGLLKGFKKCYAMMEEDCNDFAIFKKQAYEDQILRLSLIEGSGQKAAEDKMFSALSMDTMIDLSNLAIISTKVMPDKDPKGFMILTKVMR